MSLIDIYIRDKETGECRRVGDNHHDMLTINSKGQLCYQNLQNGDGCRLGEEGGGYEFIPNEDDYGNNYNPLTVFCWNSKCPRKNCEYHEANIKKSYDIYRHYEFFKNCVYWDLPEVYFSTDYA